MQKPKFNNCCGIVSEQLNQLPKENQTQKILFHIHEMFRH